MSFNSFEVELVSVSLFSFSLLTLSHFIHHVYVYFLPLISFLLLIFRWAAASNDISLNGMILPAALYFWQIPHFMALAYLCRDDYAAGGYALITLFVLYSENFVSYNSFGAL